VVRKRLVAGSLFIKYRRHNTLSANVEIGVPRSESQGLSDSPKAFPGPAALTHKKKPPTREKGDDRSAATEGLQREEGDVRQAVLCRYSWGKE
jgi:hypothetical protein